MKRIERILIKAVCIQAIFFLLTQIFFHHYDAFPELKQLIEYEGVTDRNHENIIETFQLP